MSWRFADSTAASMATDRRVERQAALRRRFETMGLDALVVSHPPNIRYLTGFTGSSGLLIMSTDRAVLITDSRYASQAPAEAGPVGEVDIEMRNLWDGVRRVLGGIGPEALGFERERMTVHAVERLRAVAPGRMEGCPGLVEELRVAKDPGEVDAIRAAGALALEALESVLPTVRPGVTELELAARLEAALRVRGSEWHPFPTIVASGPRSALPHARSSPRAIGAGELLLVDFGAQVDGYCADITRTVVVGRSPDERQREVYDAVRGAQTAALRGLRPGMSGREGDALARESLERVGLGQAFGHSLGHGLGLEVHEDPRLGPTADEAVPLHAVVTVEPGVYLPEWGGVRLEDDVFLTSEGPELLTPGAPGLMAVP